MQGQGIIDIGVVLIRERPDWEAMVPELDEVPDV